MSEFNDSSLIRMDILLNMLACQQGERVTNKPKGKPKKAAGQKKNVVSQNEREKEGSE